MKITIEITEPQLTIIKRVQGPDYDPQRLTQSYVDAKVAGDRQMLEVLEGPQNVPPGCAWDNIGDPSFDGCAGCGQACGFHTQDLKVKP